MWLSVVFGATFPADSLTVLSMGLDQVRFEEIVTAMDWLIRQLG